MKYMDTYHKLKGNYTLGSNPCEVCKKKYGTLITADGVAFCDNDLICFNCFVHRHGVDSALRVKSKLNIISELQWEFTNKELKTNPLFLSLLGGKK